MLYNNTAPTGYSFEGADQDFGIVDHGRIPSTGSPGITGSGDSYRVDCYQFGYCSGDTNPVSQISVFFAQYDPCTDIGVGAVEPIAGFLATALPTGSSTGGVNCWIIVFDLSNTTMAFSMAADGDGVFDDNPNIDSFGWLGNYPTNTAGQAIGPIISGNCAGVGGLVSDPPQGFGTAFAGIPGASNATGLGTDDFFWIDGFPSRSPGRPAWGMVCFVLVACSRVSRPSSTPAC